MDLTLSEEHEALRAIVEEFAHKEVAPVIGELYERGEFPYEIVQKMGTMGLFGLPIAEEYGGMGGDYFALCLALEELARVDSSVAITLEAGVSLGAMPIYRFGTEEQKREWLPALAAGETAGRVRPHRARRRLRRGRHPHHRPPRRRRVGDQRFEGVHHELRHRHHRRSSRSPRSPATAAPTATARSPRSWCPRARRASGCRRSTPRSAGTPRTPASCSSTTCRVPAANLVGERGRGYAQFLSILDEGRVAIAALSTGLAQGCVDESVRYAHDRQAFGRPDRLLPGHPVHDRRHGGPRAHRAAGLLRGGGEDAAPGEPFKKEAAIAKLVASNAAMDNARAATQVFGGYGFMNEYAVGRFYRDAKILEIGEGTSEVQRMLIARQLGL